MKITMTEDRLRHLVRAAYEDGHEDGYAAGMRAETHAPELDWLESAARSNLEDDIKDYPRKGTF